MSADLYSLKNLSQRSFLQNFKRIIPINVITVLFFGVSMLSVLGMVTSLLGDFSDQQGKITYSFNSYAVDDAPITYRYAKNIAVGEGFVYNPGEKILGTSTPLYTLILSLAALLGLPIHPVSLSIGIISYLLILPLGHSLAERLLPRSGPMVVLLLGTSVVLGVWASSGMETLFYTLLIFAALWVHQREKEVASYALAALVFLTRFDGLVLLIALSLAYVGMRRLPWRGWLVWLLITLPWLAFATIYFGSPLPFSYIAKTQHSSVAGEFWMLSFMQEKLQLMLSLLAAPVLTLMWRDKKGFVASLPMVVWFIGYVLAYTIAGIDRYDWYLAPAVAMLLTFSGIGLMWTLKSLKFHFGSIAVLPTALVIILLIALAIFGTNIVQLRTWSWWMKGVEGQRVASAVWLREHAAADATVKTGAIGHIGFETNLYIYDTSGLVTPSSHSGEQFEADYIVILECWPDCQHQRFDYATSPLRETYHVAWASEVVNPALGRFIILEKNDIKRP